MDRTPPQRRRSSASAGPPAAAPVVFLSYAHAEQPIALAFRDALATRGLQILIDVEDLKPAEDIAEFARRSVRTADATICLVSTDSLSSAWVVFEAVTTLHKEHAAEAAQRLIACATDEGVFRPEIQLEITQSINQRLGKINELLTRHMAEQIDINHLALEYSRLVAMRGALGSVLERLNSGLTLPLRLESVLDTATRVADHIREVRGQSPSRTDPRDICARAEEIRRHLWEGRTDEALDRTLDFVREFSDLAKHVRDATLIANTLRRIAAAESHEGLEFDKAESRRQPAIYQLLELIDEVELNPQVPVVK